MKLYRNRADSMTFLNSNIVLLFHDSSGVANQIILVCSRHYHLNNW